MMTKRESRFFRVFPEYNRVCVTCKQQFNTKERGLKPNAINCSDDCTQKYNRLTTKEKEARRLAAAKITIALMQENKV